MKCVSLSADLVRDLCITILGTHEEHTELVLTQFKNR